MTNPNEDLLATTEGVDEGSAKSTTEGLPPTEELTGVTNPISRALGDPDRVDERADAQPAPPVDMEPAEAREARAERGTGQQQQVGEG